MTDRTEIEARLAVLSAEIKERSNEAARLETLLEGPLIGVLACYWRYHCKCEDVCESITEAQSLLTHMSDSGECSPIGVSINGVIRDWERAAWPT